jgi:hypothetical protein
MNWQGHLFTNWLLYLVIYFTLDFLFNYTIEPGGSLFIAWCLFSILPDIDHSGSNATVLFFIGYLGLFIFGIVNLFQSNIPWGTLAIITSILIGAYHFNIMSDGYSHRVFPHTFSFGIICSLILWYFTSMEIAIFGLIFFISHLVCDINQHWGLKDIIEYDIDVLSGNFGAIFKREN